MNIDTVRLWLLEKPRATSLRLTCGGETRIITYNPSHTFQKLAASIVALEPELIEALDKDGNTIRATRGETSELAVEATPARAVPGVPPTLVDTATLQLVAKLIADAYKHSNEVAFERLASLFDSVNRRSENLERSLALSERMRVKMAELGAAPEEEGGELGNIIRSFLGGASPPEKTTNGKGH